MKWQGCGRWWWWWSAHQCTIPPFSWRDWGWPQEASIRTDTILTKIQNGHPPNKILQHYYYNNFIRVVRWYEQWKSVRNSDTLILFRVTFFAPETARPCSRKYRNKHQLQAHHTRKKNRENKMVTRVTWDHTQPSGTMTE